MSERTAPEEAVLEAARAYSRTIDAMVHFREQGWTQKQMAVVYQEIKERQDALCVAARELGKDGR